MNGFPTTNGRVRSSAIHRTFRYYRIKKLIFINLAFASLNTQSSENYILCTISVFKVRYYIMKTYYLFFRRETDERE